MVQNEVLVKPLITEKTALYAEDKNCYGFLVNLKASKTQIKQAVEKNYNVKVEKVRTSVSAGKTKRAGFSYKKLLSFKKAYVQLAAEQKIEFFKDV